MPLFVTGALIVLVLQSGTDVGATDMRSANAPPTKLTPLEPPQASSCSSVSNNDMRYLCEGSCSSINDNDLRYYCSSSSSSINHNDFGRMRARGCSSINDNDLRYYCDASNKRFPFRR